MGVQGKALEFSNTILQLLGHLSPWIGGDSSGLRYIEASDDKKVEPPADGHDEKGDRIVILKARPAVQLDQPTRNGCHPAPPAGL